MKKILFLNTIHCKAWKNRALFLMLALVISMSNVYAATYKSTMNVAGSPTGAGSVYVSDKSGATSGEMSASKEETKQNPPDHTYYIYANAGQGYYFQEWQNTSGNITFGNSSESSTTAKITAGTGNGTSGTATAIFKPNVKITGASAEEIHATFTEDSQADKTCEAVFDVENAESDADFDAPTIGGEDSDKFSNPQIMSYANNKVTISFVYNGNKEVGEHNATLTLKVIDQKGGTDQTYGSKTITLIAHNEQEAVNEVSVTTAGGVTTEYATWAEGLAAANANAGCTLTLLRNIDLGTITATNNITKAMTIDLNGKTLQAAVDKASTGLLTLNAAVEVTIKDSKTGGRIINEIARNSEIRTIFVNKAGATLTLESGTIAVNNLGQYASAAATVDGVAVAKYASCSARAIHQIAGSTVNINGGKLDAKGTRSVYGIVQGSSAATNKAGTTVLNVTGGEIAVEAPYNAFGIHAYGKVNMSAGVINTHITTNLIDAAYAADHGNNTNNGNGYGIQMKVSVSATASSCYYGTLSMTGGTINVISDRTKKASLYNYGIYLEAVATGVGAGKTATDGTLSQKASAKASIENANITVHSNTYYSYGIIVYGSYNSYDNEYFTVPIKNCNIDVQAYLYTYAICANAAVNSTYGGCYWGDVELTGNTVTAESVTDKTAYAVYVLAATAHIFKDANTTTAPIYYGEYATAAKAVINSGTYTAKTKTTTAFAVCSSTRAKTIYDSETKVEANRKLGGNAEAYPTVIIHGGTFRGEATTTTSRAVSTGGYTTINGGTFEAYSGTTTAYGLCCVSGTMKATNAVVTASATGTAYGAFASCGIPDNTTAQTGFAYAGDMTLTNCTITATTRTGTEARGVCVNATNKLHTFAQFVTDSTTRKWSAATAAAYRAIYPCTVQGRDSVGVVIAGKVTINDCTIKAKAATTKAYAVHSAAKQIQGEKETAPSIVINSGKFWSEATSDYADISPECVPGYCVVKGGYYKNDAYITPVLDEGYNVFALQQNKEEHKTAYNEGYRWHVTNDFTGEIVCKVTHGSITNIYDKLESAFNYVNEINGEAATIILCANYTLSAGNYTIPQKVTLLIPYDENHILSTTVKRINDANGIPTCYRYLTLAENVSISADGNIEVGGVQNNGGQLNVAVGAPRNHGKIRMHANSLITLNGGSNLYCWGYIVGAEDDSEGTIIAKNGSTVHECLQIRDWKGGTASQNMVGNTNKAFPVTQYYIQNIETPITYEYGSTNKVSTGVIVSNYNLDVNDAVFIGSSSGLFRLLENPDTTKLKRDYIEETDRIEYTLEKGSATFNNINLKFEFNGDAGLVGGIVIQQILNKLNIKSEEYVMPFTNNMTTRIKENAKITISSDVSLLPGVELYTEKNSTTITNGTTYLYDKDEWIGYENVEIYSIPYANEQNLKASPIRTWDKINDAKACINGLLEVGGSIYTTESGADICSTESGKIKFTKNAPSTDATVYQITGSGPDYTGKTAHPAWLHNDEEMNQTEPYTQTSGAVAGDEFVYSQYYGKWLKNPKVITWDATTNGGTCETPQTVLPPGTKVPELPIATKTGYTFKGWFTEASGGAQITTETPVTEDVTYYAQFELEVGPQLDIVDADGTNLTINANGWASSGWPYTINDTPYEKGDREDDRTLVIPYSGQPNNDMPIEVKDKEGNIISSHIYKVFVYDSNTTMSGTDENSIVFVKSGTLSIEGTASAKEIYVAPGAELEVTGTLDVKKLVLRTTPFEAAILTNKGTIVGQVYYSRIARDTDFHLFAIPAGSNTANVVLSDGSSCAVNSTTTPYGAAWQLREYNTARRAAEGATGANWDNIGVNGDGKTYSDVAIEASKGYELRSGSKYYREYLFPVTLPTTATSVGVIAATGAAGAAHAGWNILCSPYVSTYTLTATDPATGIKVCWQQEDGTYIQSQPTSIPPATPFAYQASASGSLDFSTSTLALKAPRRQSAAEALTETEWIHLDIFDAYGEGDETSLFVHPTRFEQTYKTGIDVAKQSLTASRAILYTAHAYGNMAFAGVADTLLENGIDVIVYSPTEQQLTFSLRENAFLNRLEYLWLADNKTGARTDLLLNDYTFRAAAGTDKQRFVLNGRFKAPQIATGIGNTQTDYNIYAIGNNIAISGVEQGTPIYVFDAVGRMIYTTAATTAEVIVPAPCAGVYMLSVGGQTAKLVINQ